MRIARIILVALSIAHPVASHAQASANVDVTGKWLFSVNTGQGTGTPTVTFKQQGDSVSGHYSSQLLGEHDFKGTVKDGKLSFTMNIEIQGTPVTVTYSGTVESKDALKGTVDFGGQMGGTFTAKRQ